MGAGVTGAPDGAMDARGAEVARPVVTHDTRITGISGNYLIICIYFNTLEAGVYKGPFRRN